MKAHIRRYLNEGNDVTTGHEMKVALDSYGGIGGVKVAVVDVNTERQNIKSHKWDGITQFNNFQFSNSKIVAWKAFNIGVGKKFLSSFLKKVAVAQDSTQLIVKEGFTECNKKTGILKGNESKKETQTSHTSKESAEVNEPFSCPEEGCIKSYRSDSNLQRHLDYGKHQFKLHRESQYDYVKRRWAAVCTGIKSENITTSSSCNNNESTVAVTTLPTGWALKKRRKNTRFSPRVRSYLLETFLQGEETGRKVSPQDATNRMRSKKDEAGNMVFAREEWLTVQQVKSYFSRLSSLKRNGAPLSRIDPNVDLCTLNAVSEAVERQQIKESIQQEMQL